MQNRTIQLASILGQLIIGICGFLYVLFLIALIYWHIDPAAFRLVDLSDAFKAGYGVNGIQFYKQAEQLPSDAVLMSDLSRPMMYWLFLRVTIFVALTILITRTALKVVHSIKSLRTFYNDNPRHLKNIALYAFIAFVFSIFNFIFYNGTSELNLKTAFGPLVLAVAALVLAEVFNEGKKLLEEQNLII
jgi:hypothetical protein